MKNYEDLAAPNVLREGPYVKEHPLEAIAEAINDYAGRYEKEPTQLAVDNLTIWDIVVHNVAEFRKEHTHMAQCMTKKGLGTQEKSPGMEEALAMCDRTFMGLPITVVISSERFVLATDRAGVRELEDRYDPEH